MNEFQQRAQEIVNSIQYKPGWAISLHQDSQRGLNYIQVSFTSKCAITMQEARQYSGKVFLSEHMCQQEIVGVCAGLIERAEFHEMREFFKYKGKAIYNPHIDPDALASVADNLSVRS